MIIFKEIKVRNNEYWLVFENENSSRVEIPSDQKQAKMFSVYFDKLSPQKIEVVPEDIED